MVLANTQGAAKYAQGRAEQCLDALTKDIASDGTYTLAGLEHLDQQKVFENFQSAMQMIGSKFDNQ